jgi:hypothetical protein
MMPSHELTENNVRRYAIAVGDFEDAVKLAKLLRNRVLAHAEYSFYPSSFNTETGVMSRRRSSLMSPIIENGFVVWPFDIELLCSLAEKLATQCHHKRADYAGALRKR